MILVVNYKFGYNGNLKLAYSLIKLYSTMIFKLSMSALLCKFNCCKFKSPYVFSWIMFNQLLSAYFLSFWCSMVNNGFFSFRSRLKDQSKQKLRYLRATLTKTVVFCKCKIRSLMCLGLWILPSDQHHTAQFKIFFNSIIWIKRLLHSSLYCTITDSKYSNDRYIKNVVHLKLKAWYQIT